MKQIDARVIEQLRLIEAHGRPGLMVKLVGAFTDIAHGAIADLRGALDARETERLWRAAHRLRSGAIAIGAAQVAARCRTIEEVGRNGALGGLRANVEQLDAEVGVALALLRALAVEPAADAG